MEGNKDKFQPTDSKSPRPRGLRRSNSARSDSADSKDSFNANSQTRHVNSGGAKNSDELNFPQRKSSDNATNILKLLAAGSSKEVVTKESFHAVLHQKVVERSSCVSLPFTVVFFVFYMMMVLAHEDVYTTYRTERAIRSLVENVNCEGAETKLSDVIVASDVWRWLRGSIICRDSEWFQQLDSQGNTLPKDEWARVLGANRLYGGMLLEQARTQKTTCGVDLPYDWNCYPKEESRLSENAVFGLWHANQSTLPEEYAERLYYENEGFAPLIWEGADDENRLLGAGMRGSRVDMVNERIWGLNMAPSSERYPFFFLEQEAVKDLRTRLRYLEEGAWIDDQTEIITLKANLVNAEVALITRVTIIFRFGMPGGMDAALRLQSSPMSIYKSASGPFIDAIWLFMLCAILVSTLKTWCIARRKGQLKEYWQTLWNWVDILTVIFGFIIILGFAVQREAIDRLLASMDAVDFNREVDRTYLKGLHKMHHLADSIVKGTMWYRILLGDYVLLLMLRFFKAYRAQPRLALVTATMQAAAADLIHFTIVFMSIFVSFAYASVVLFGQKVSGFSSFWQSVATCWAIICGDLSWKEISVEHPVTAALWFCSFMLLTYFVLLNMVLAVVMDVYTQLRSEMTSGDTLWVQCKKACQTLASQGLRKSYQSQKEDKELIEKLDQLGDMICEADVLALCPTKSAKQVEALFRATRELETNQEKKGLGLMDALGLIGEMSKHVLHIQEMVATMKNGKCWRHIEKNVLARMDVRTRRADKALKALVGAMHSGELKKILRDFRKRPRPASAMNKKVQSRAGSESAIPHVDVRSGTGTEFPTHQFDFGLDSSAMDASNDLKAASMPAIQAQLDKAQLLQEAQLDKAQFDMIANVTRAVREAVRSEFHLQSKALRVETHDWAANLAANLKDSVCKDMRELFKIREARKTQTGARSSPRGRSPKGSREKPSKGVRRQQSNEGQPSKSLSVEEAIPPSPCSQDADMETCDVDTCQQLLLTNSSLATSPAHATDSVKREPTYSVASRGNQPSHPNSNISPKTAPIFANEAGEEDMPLPSRAPFAAGPPTQTFAEKRSQDVLRLRQGGTGQQQQDQITEQNVEYNQYDAAGGLPPAWMSSAACASDESTAQIQETGYDNSNTNNDAHMALSAPDHQELTDEGLQIYHDESDQPHPSPLLEYPFEQSSARHSPHTMYSPAFEQVSSMNETLQQLSPRADERRNEMRHPEHDIMMTHQGHIVMTDQGPQLIRALPASSSQPHQDQFVILPAHQVAAPQQMTGRHVQTVPHVIASQQFIRVSPQSARRHAPLMDASHPIPSEALHPITTGFANGPPATSMGFVRVKVHNGEEDELA